MNRPRFKRRRWLALAGVAALVTLILLARRPGEAALREERLRAAGLLKTPAEVNAWYELPPADENFAGPLLDAVQAIRYDREDTNLPFVGIARNPAPGEPWSDVHLAAARAFRRTNEVPLLALRTALKRPRSRYPGDLSNGYRALFPHLSAVQKAGRILALEACLDAEEDRLQDAMIALTNGLHVADCLEAEPALISHLVALGIRSSESAAAERVLSRRGMEDADLVVLQERFLESERTTSMTRALVGELANYSNLLRQPWSRIRVMGGGSGPPSSPGEIAADVALRLYCLLGLSARDRNVGLRHFDGMLSVAALPVEERFKAAQKVQGETDRILSKHTHPFAGMLLPSIASIGDVTLRGATLLRCAATACAVERFRIAHGGERPEALDELVPGFLPSVPADPWTGQPLRYRMMKSGYVVYGVGADGLDDGGVARANRRKGSNDGYDETFTVGR